MGLQFTSKNIVGAAARLPMALPVKDGLVAAYLTYGNTSQLKTNYFDAVDDAQITGAPVISTQYASFEGESSFIETPIIETPEFTFFSVVKLAHETGNAFALGSFGASSAGANIYLSPANFNISASYTTGSKFAGVAHNGKIGLVVASASNREYRILNKTSGGGATFPVMDGSLRSPSGRKLRIGSGYTGSGKNKVDVSLVVIYDRALTDIEIDAVCEAIRRVTKSIGLDV